MIKVIFLRRVRWIQPLYDGRYEDRYTRVQHVDHQGPHPQTYHPQGSVHDGHLRRKSR